MINIFALAGVTVTREQVVCWLKKDEDERFVVCTDEWSSAFLNGFIIEKRGKKEGALPVIDKRLTNNMILTKLKIALSLQAEDIIELLEKVNFSLSKHELSAFARKLDHKHYRECKDQVIRKFLEGIDKKFHVKRETYTAPVNKLDASKNKAESGKSAKGASKNSNSFDKQSAHKSTYKGKSDNNKSQSKVSKEQQAPQAWVNGAKPNASKIYVNPNIAPKEKPVTERKVLKLKN